MRVGIISDTHGSVRAWRDALQGPFRDVEQIFHCGDLLYHGPRNPLPAEYDPQKLAAIINRCSLPILAVRGNCDSEVDQMVLDLALQAPYFLTEQARGRILVTHGHQYSPEQVGALAAKFKVGIWISGHTHLPLLEKVGRTVFLNPGSPSLPKGKRPRRSVALLTSEEIRLVDLDSGRPYQTLVF